MLKSCLALVLLILTVPSAYADDFTDVGVRVSQLQGNDSSLPAVPEQKGKIGTIIASLFTTTSPRVIKAKFLGIVPVNTSGIITLTSTYVPRWTGTQFANGAIRDNGTNIGIGTAPASDRVTVSGDQLVTGDIKASRLCDTAGNNCVAPSSISI